MRSPLPLLLLCACAANNGDISTEPGDLIEGEAKADTTTGGVEIKITVRADQIPYASSRLNLSADRAERRTIYFYDTSTLALFESGTILRARKVRDGSDDSTVKRKPMAAGEVAPRWLAERGFKCETDRVGDRAVGACSLTSTQDRGEIDDVAAGRRAVAKLYSDEQELFLRTYGGEPAWTALRPMGPIDALVWRVRPSGFPAGLTAERWQLPDGRLLLELSTRASAGEADAVAARFAAYLGSKGLDTSAAQETKTRVALEYFAGRSSP